MIYLAGAGGLVEENERKIKEMGTHLCPLAHISM